MLHRLFTYAAILEVQAHLEGAGNDGGFVPQNVGLDGEVEAPPYAKLREAMEQVPLGDGDDFCEEMLKRDPAVGLRVLEVRKAYAREMLTGRSSASSPTSCCARPTRASCSGTSGSPRGRLAATRRGLRRRDRAPSLSL